ncbi:hypothetical protein [Paenibacillus sp. Soil522]|uniref:hypothetical protein n=1 Tax=Paenibacillus sp. Soil522 TaxID=1736388 RepID=UPI0006F72C67|nr:hypothetical protein [Paenibacillus sp. Soil522]KRE39944.1 hypothetical protein ASG81_18665 [Paenibacillus sp. Soil522]
MLPQHRPISPLFRFICIFVVIALFAGIAFTLLRDREEAPPPITEHAFESGHAIWSIDDYPAKVLHSNHFLIELTDLSGAPLQGAGLTVKLNMLNMICGDYEFSMTETAPGMYSGEGVPLMAGTWKAALTLVTGDHTYTIIRVLRAIH